MVIKGNLVLQEGRKDTITSPMLVVAMLIVEVLSESTAYYDRGQKFTYYRSIPSFQEYLLVDQYTYSVQHYQKISDTKWEFEEFNSLEEEIEFTSIPCRISLMDTYEKVEL
jgi:Uma2 family endonuclease